MNFRMHSSKGPAIIKQGRAPREALARSLLIDGHFLRVAEASKLIWTSLLGMFSASISFPRNLLTRFLRRSRAYIRSQRKGALLLRRDGVFWLRLCKHLKVIPMCRLSTHQLS